MAACTPKQKARENEIRGIMMLMNRWDVSLEDLRKRGMA
jgi:hypothetical protein